MTLNLMSFEDLVNELRKVSLKKRYDNEDDDEDV